MTTRTTSRAIGGLILSAFLLYGGGTFLVDSTTGSTTPVPENAASLSQLTAGAILLLLNSAAAVAIGLLAYRVLRRRGHRRTANVYLATRTVEASLLALAPLGTLTLALFAGAGTDTPTTTGSGWDGLALLAVDNSESAYWLAMATLGLGSIFFCRALLKSALLPRLLATWGMAGYAIFALGSLLQLTGYEVGLVMSAPGGLFEVAAGCYLVVKGFQANMPNGARVTPDASRVERASAGV